MGIELSGDILRAEEALEQALELDPDNVEAHAYYAEVMIDQDYVDKASEHSKAAVQLDPYSLEARRARGYVLYLTGNYNEAEIEFHTALEINNRVSDLHLSLGLVYWAQGRLNEAIDEFNIADTLDPDDPRPATSISRIYLYLGEYAKAGQFAKSAVEDDPTNPRRYGNWGVALYKNLQYQEAIDVFSIAIHGGTTDDGQVVVGMPLENEVAVAEYFYMYGLALAYTRRCSEALPIFQALIAGVPGNSIALDNADTGIAICEEYIANPPTPTPGPTDEPIPPTETPTSTETP